MEETSSGLKAEMKPEDHCKIAQDEDEGGHSNKPGSSVDISEIAQEEDEQHSDKVVGVHAIKDHGQEHGRAGEHLQALLDLDNDTIGAFKICRS